MTSVQIKAGMFVLMLLMSCITNAQEKPWNNIGRKATAGEVKAWDIDVRGDFKGLPKGQGSVAQGEQIWEAKCASCHGAFGELNEVFPPLIGGTTADDMKRGIVAANAQGGVAQKTMMMKLARLSTLWDYINRAMPWNAPKSLQSDEVYAVIAYLMNLSAVVPSDFNLTNENIAQVQQWLPNRNGLVYFDALWGTQGRPDVKNIACMSNCPTEPISSSLPDFARNAHGNLSEQNRLIGAVRGTDTTRPAAPAVRTFTAVNTSPTLGLANADQGKTTDANHHTFKEKERTAALDVKAILAKNACTACHGVTNKIVGPSFREIATKYKTKADADAYLSSKIKSGGSGAWGAVAMPPQAQLKQDEIKAITAWLIAGAK